MRPVLCALAAGSLTLPLAARQDVPLAPSDVTSPQVYSLPDTREARGLWERAEQHIGAGRWNYALTDLQTLLEAHRGDVLPYTGGSLYPFHTGAAEWAAGRLARLPSEARALYCDRHARSSEQALERARAEGDRRALAAVATRWPVTPAAERAWWTLGDLELELGNLEEAVRAWMHADEFRRAAGRGQVEGTRARVDFALRLQGDGADSIPVLARPERTQTELRLAGPGEGGGPVPIDEANSWTFQLPEGPFDGSGDNQHNLFPVLAEGTLLVNTSLRLVAVDAHTGTLAWMSDEPLGWGAKRRDDRMTLLAGVNLAALLLAPAASRGVAVAALQIPWTSLKNTSFQGIPITTAIPERRLFAFDLASGRPLWSHAPPPTWDGEDGSYAQRMSVAGPPVIAGARVLVPCYRLQGRIDYQVACYDISSGKLLWSTALVSGQRELNMFGRHQKEYCAPPLRVEGDRVIALSQLGAVASLDLFSGRIQWESVYEPIPLPRTHGWDASNRTEYWRNAPPVVADGAVIVAPVDSMELVAYDLRDGAVLWSYPYHKRGRTTAGRRADVLLGASRDTIYLGGDVIVALRKNGGLRVRYPGEPVDAWPPYVVGDRSSSRSPRALLGQRDILVPADTEVFAIDSTDGQKRPHKSIPWVDGREGNLLLADGALFILSAGRLYGFFDWKVLLERAWARLEVEPRDRQARLSLAQLLQQRAASQQRDGRLRDALSDLRRSETLLRGLLDEPGADLDRELAQALHQGLRQSARAHLELADVPGALEHLEEARRFAASRNDVRDTLLEEEALVRDRQPQRWLTALGDLERLCADLALPADGRHLTSDPVLRELVGDAPALDSIPVGLWVLFERALYSGEVGDAAGELADLHAVLARFGERNVTRDLSARALAAARIARRLERGERGAYQAYEEAGQALLDQGVSASDEALIDRVTLLYPHSAAARRARAQRLEWSFARGELPAVAELVRESLSRELVPSARDVALLLQLGELLAREGNLELQAGLVASLAQSWPELVSPLALHGGRTLHELARDVAAPAPPAPRSERSHFDATLTRAHQASGPFVPLGEVQVRARGELSASTSLLLVADSERLDAWSPGDADGGGEPGSLAWSFVLPRRITRETWGECAVIAPGRVVLNTFDAVIGIDAASGAQAWRWGALRHVVRRIGGTDGVVLAEMLLEGERTRVVGLDVRTGSELWELDVDTVGQHPTILGDGRAVFLSTRFVNSVRASVVDVFRGRVLGQLELGGDLGRNAEDQAWIEQGLLVVPSFTMVRFPERNHVVAFDLRRMERAWSVEFGASVELFAIAHHGPETYLYLHSSGADGDGGSIELLDVRTGSIRSVYSLRAGEEPIGLERGTRRQLAGPYLFVLAGSATRGKTAVTAVRLPYGKHWGYLLPVSYDDLYHGSMPVPALSDSTVALSYTTADHSGNLERESFLLLLDRASGRQRQLRVLSGELAGADELELVGLGELLMIVGRGHRRPGQLEIWRRSR